MNNEERAKRFADIGNSLWKLADELEQLSCELSLEVDRKAIHHALPNLRWSAENCSVISKHQVGEAMQHDMGLTWDGKVQ
jgi:hypothetical protein